KGLGLFLYYSYACDWKHPYFYPREAGCDFARPAYDKPQPGYLWKQDADFKHYVEFVHKQLRELLTQYGPVAGMWFDPIMGYYFRPDLFPVHETYALVRSLQPQTLIVFKQGATGTEDFASPEHAAGSLVERLKQRKASEAIIAVARNAWERNKGRHNEICTTMHPWWGHVEDPNAKHKTPDEVMAALADAAAHDCNLLLNTGPLPDGSINAVDAATLREVGRRLRESGFPKPTQSQPHRPGGTGPAVA
ncbi:MAG: hypothetical protein FJ279_04180, partial [Planctomycetes bacterium]|nr:hypothetical protein [Planctomycetota bacterium]